MAAELGDRHVTLSGGRTITQAGLGNGSLQDAEFQGSEYSPPFHFRLLRSDGAQDEQSPRGRYQQRHNAQHRRRAVHLSGFESAAGLDRLEVLLDHPASAIDLEHLMDLLEGFDRLRRQQEATRTPPPLRGG